MSRIRIVIADAQLETVPEQLWNENAVKNDSKRRKRHPSKILLYTPIHYTAMLKHGINVKRRGRPDITQDILKAIINHPLNRELDIEIYIYTINGELFWISSKTRIPHNYYQFEGLMVQLLKKGMVPPDTGEFMKKMDINLDELLKGDVYLLHEDGIDIDETTFPMDRTLTFVIGGFQEGDYSEKFHRIRNRISVYKEPLYAGTAACILLTRLWRMTR